MARTVTDIVEHLMTSPNPETGSRPPECIAWVVFSGGTVFFATPDEDLEATATPEELKAAARQALRELGPVVPGSPAGDFSASLLRTWFPGEFVYFISYDHPAVATIVLADRQDDLAAGIAGRMCRSADHAAMQVELVRDFAGRKHH